MTQHEALARRVPAFFSQQCAKVVRHRENGWIMDSAAPETVVEALHYAWNIPEEVVHWSRAAAVPEECGMASVSKNT